MCLCPSGRLQTCKARKTAPANTTVWGLSKKSKYFLNFTLLVYTPLRILSYSFLPPLHCFLLSLSSFVLSFVFSFPLSSFLFSPFSLLSCWNNWEWCSDIIWLILSPIIQLAIDCPARKARVGSFSFHTLALHLTLWVLIASFKKLLVAEMAQWGKVHATKSDNLSWIPRTHGEEEEKQLLPAINSFSKHDECATPHTHTP